MVRYRWLQTNKVNLFYQTRHGTQWIELPRVGVYSHGNAGAIFFEPDGMLITQEKEGDKFTLRRSTRDITLSSIHVRGKNQKGYRIKATFDCSGTSSTYATSKNGEAGMAKAESFPLARRCAGMKRIFLRLSRTPRDWEVSGSVQPTSAESIKRRIKGLYPSSRSIKARMSTPSRRFVETLDYKSDGSSSTFSSDETMVMSDTTSDTNTALTSYAASMSNASLEPDVASMSRLSLKSAATSSLDGSDSDTTASPVTKLGRAAKSTSNPRQRSRVSLPTTPDNFRATSFTSLDVSIRRKHPLSKTDMELNDIVKESRELTVKWEKELSCIQKRKMDLHARKERLEKGRKSTIHS
ncbi:MAG: hypothetical protein Q9170_002133 [Blastenia crenularia]